MSSLDVVQLVRALGSFDYVSANKHVMRVGKAHQSSGTLCTRLIHCENLYSSMQFLKPKLFRKEDYLHGQYNDIVLDLERESLQRTGTLSSANGIDFISPQVGRTASDVTIHSHVGGNGNSGGGQAVGGGISGGSGSNNIHQIHSGAATAVSSVAGVGGFSSSSVSPNSTFHTGATNPGGSATVSAAAAALTGATGAAGYHSQSFHSSGPSILSSAPERSMTGIGSGINLRNGGNSGGSSTGTRENGLGLGLGLTASEPGVFHYGFPSYGPDEPTLIEYAALCNFMKELCGMRITMIDIYRMMASSTVDIDVEDALSKTDFALLMYDSTSDDFRNTVLGIGLQQELLILRHGLLTEKAVQDYDIQKSTINLHLSRTALADWRRLTSEQDYVDKSISRPEETSWRHTLFSTADDKKKQSNKGKHNLQPNHMIWLGRWTSNQKSKMTLYFMDILLEKEQGVGGDERSLWAGVDTDIHGMIRTFRKKAGARSISLVYEISPTNRFSSQGYLSQNAPYEPPTGVNSFPCIYSYPPGPPRDHWPNIISIMQGSQNVLQQYKSQHFYDRKIGCTYYCASVGTQVTIVIIYLDKHIQPEAGAMDFLQLLASKLRHTEILQALKAD